MLLAIYLSIDIKKQQVTRQGQVFIKKTMLIIHFLKGFWRNNEHKFVLYSTKTIKLLALNFYEAIVNSGFILVNYHLIEILSS